LEKELVLGNISISRDWGYAPEFIKAMWLMLQQDKPDDYVICSGEHHSLEIFTKLVFKKLDLDFDKYVKRDDKHLRPVDLKIIYGDNSKAKKELKWKYDITLEELIDKLIEDEYKFFEWEAKNRNF
jgi:GDPmannose 4,6-dehydratase